MMRSKIEAAPPPAKPFAADEGDNVTAIVDGCTDSDITPKPPWRQRKEAYIDRILTDDRRLSQISLGC